MQLRLITAAVAFPIIATAGYAQSTTTTPSTTPPAAESTMNSSAAAIQWYQAQPGEHRTSKLVGTKVTNNADETIGEINEIVLASDGSASAAIIGVGGFLGLGEHEVAVAFKSLNITRDKNGVDVIKLNATKDALKAAPQWSWKNA